VNTIPLVDLKAAHQLVALDVRVGMDQVMADTAFIGGLQIANFESAYAAFSAVRHCVGVANGTDALELALRACGIGPGHEVALPANTFVATALAVVRAGARPVLVDCDARFQLMDMDQLALKLTAHTKAVMPVHLFGQMAPMRPLMELAHTRKLLVVEDAAQAHGAKQGGLFSGGVGDVAGTSFYPGKNLGAYGDAGGVLTNSDAVAEKIRALRNYGSAVKYHHPEIGFNSRLDTLQAVVLSAKLKHLAQGNEARRRAADHYHQMLAGVRNVVRPETMPGNLHVWHLYVVRVPERDAVLQKLHDNGVGAGVHYPVPIHLQGAFRFLGHQLGDFPVSEKAAGEILSLPMYPEITLSQQEQVVAALKKAVA
jgi:dTDP-4-amino-4,6-dideoxygalactose transaminase